MKKSRFVLLLTLLGASTAFAESFECSDYFGKTTFSVSYHYTDAKRKTVRGHFDLKSSKLPNGAVSGTFFNYIGEPDNYTINNLDCTQENETGYCVEESGDWLAAGGGYNLTFGGTNRIDAIVTCHGEVP